MQIDYGGIYFVQSADALPQQGAALIPGAVAFVPQQQDQAFMWNGTQWSEVPINSLVAVELMVLNQMLFNLLGGAGASEDPTQIRSQMAQQL